MLVEESKNVVTYLCFQLSSVHFFSFVENLGARQDQVDCFHCFSGKLFIQIFK